MKESADFIAQPLASIIDCAIRPHRYPVNWKRRQVTSVFKKDDEYCKANYRPVTLLPVFNNIFDRLLACQIDDFYRAILSDFISSYRTYYSCETSLLRMTEDCRRMKDRGELVAVVSMDSYRPLM